VSTASGIDGHTRAEIRPFPHESQTSTRETDSLAEETGFEPPVTLGAAAELPGKQLLHGPVGLVDRRVRVGYGSGIGIGDRDRPEPGAADPSDATVSGCVARAGRGEDKRPADNAACGRRPAQSHQSDGSFEAQPRAGRGAGTEDGGRDQAQASQGCRPTSTSADAARIWRSREDGRSCCEAGGLNRAEATGEGRLT
jgi:hypothetical protein